MRIPRRKGALAVGVPSRRAQVAAVFALAALLGVSVLYDSAHIAASLRRHGAGPRAYAKLSSDDGAAAVSSVAKEEAAPAVDEAGKQSPPAQAAESAPVEGTDRTDPPPHPQQHQEEEDKAEAAAKPGATAGSSVQDAPLIEEAVQGEAAGHGDGGAHEQRPETCDLYKGRWVYDESRAPIYKESGCGFLTEQVTCMRNGRRDDDYQKWRWQPDGCDLPRYVYVAAAASTCFLPCLPLHFLPLPLPPFPQLQYTCISTRIRVRSTYGPGRVVGSGGCVRAFAREPESGGWTRAPHGRLRAARSLRAFFFVREPGGSVSASGGLRGSFGLIFLVRSVWTW